MILYSFVRNTLGLSPVEVEVILQKGLPKIEILGLPDRGLQESLVRIQAAIVNQGFEFPKAHRVVVNVRPIETKKSSLGLELSIALAILHLTDQKKLPQEKSFYVYGELSLAGEIQAPKDLELIPLLDKELITGPVNKEFTSQAMDFYALEALNGEYRYQRGSGAVVSFERPKLTDLKLSAATGKIGRAHV